jgi:hypothetical protein
VRRAEQFVPARYNRQSMLRATIAADDAGNEHHFELKSGAK